MNRLIKRLFAGFDTFDGKEEDLFEYRFTKKGTESLEWLLIHKEEIEKLLISNKIIPG